ncbi:MAG: mandelate racemase [Armatimonadetes bacterium]|nr:mandelate racemase [Armatimonadota bacterium]
MKIESIEVIPLNLPFKTEFKISRGSVGGPKAGAPHAYVRIVADGILGWGEARPSPRWSYETLESVVTSIRNYLAPALIGMDAEDLDAIHNVMDQVIAPGITVGQPIAKSGIDMALHDIICKRKGIPLYKYFSKSSSKLVNLSFLTTVDSPHKAEEVTAEALKAGYRGFKVKIGMDPSLDLNILRAVKEVAGNCFLWADANQAYSVDIAIRRSKDMAKIGVDVLEQPVPANDFLALQELVAKSAIPIAVDESVFSVGDLEQLIIMKALNFIVIKVSKMAGLTGARRCIERALDAGIGLLGSGLTETRLGLAASAHLYSAFGFEYPVDLNGPQFLADDPVKGGIVIKRASVILSEAAGIGVDVDEIKLGQYAIQI